MKRRAFNKMAGSAVALTSLGFTWRSEQERAIVMTVSGAIQPEQMGITLPHEHMMVDFMGAEKVSPDRYQEDEVFRKVLPYLEEIWQLGCKTFVDCTPQYLGRDARLLKRLAEASNLQVLTNTGYYGARNGFFLPKHVKRESPEKLSRRWITEFNEGIDGTDIRPGFIKIGVDNGPLPKYNQKIVKAAALTHLASGMTIAAHTGDANAAFEELEIIQSAGVDPSAFIWVHAQNQGAENHVKAARMGAWVEIDGISLENYEDHAKQIDVIRKAGLLNKVLISCDAGWYHVGEPQGGTYRSHATVLNELLMHFKSLDFTEEEVAQLLVSNSAEAFTIRVRKK